MSTTNQNIQWDEKNSIEPKKNCLNNTAIDPNDIIKDINKNSIKSQCKDTGAISGIYKIVNKVNGKYYVGSSNDVCGKFGRWYEHRQELNKNVHTNDHLQNAWNKYGESNFEFMLVEQCDVSNLLIIEQHYLDIAKLEKAMVYNISFLANRLEMTTEINAKISKAKKGKYKGKDNPNYIDTPEHILPKAKKIWIENGRTVLDSYLRSLGYKWGIIERLICMFKSDKDALQQRKTHFSLNHKKHAKNLKVKSGDDHYTKKCTYESHPKSDKKQYRLINLITGEIFIGNRNEFKVKYVFKNSVNDLFRGKIETYKNWKISSVDM